MSEILQMPTSFSEVYKHHSVSKIYIMKKNMGNTDRIIRVLLAIAFAALYFTNTVTGTLGIVLLVFAVVFLITSFIGVCPLYSLLGFSTCGSTLKT